MKTKILTVVFLIGILSVVNAQDNVDKNEMVGFACYWEGSQSKTVEQFTKKLEKENFSWVSKQLQSENNAEKFMSVITLEKLNKVGKYKLSKTELNLIAEIKGSAELVSVCSGCTYFQKVELKDMFSKKMLRMSNYWLKINIKTE